MSRGRRVSRPVEAPRPAEKLPGAFAGIAQARFFGLDSPGRPNLDTDRITALSARVEFDAPLSFHRGTLFFGQNALHDALEAFGLRRDAATGLVCWTVGAHAITGTGPLVHGAPLGVHAKVYLFEPWISIFASQNNAASPLIEFAIVVTNRRIYQEMVGRLRALKG